MKKLFLIVAALTLAGCNITHTMDKLVKGEDASSSSSKSPKQEREKQKKGSLVKGVKDFIVGKKYSTTGSPGEPRRSAISPSGSLSNLSEPEKYELSKKLENDIHSNKVKPATPTLQRAAATVAQTGGNVTPEAVALELQKLPSKSSDEEKDSGDETYRTAEDGSWNENSAIREAMQKKMEEGANVSFKSEKQFEKVELNIATNQEIKNFQRGLADVLDEISKKERQSIVLGSSTSSRIREQIFYNNGLFEKIDDSLGSPSNLVESLLLRMGNQQTESNKESCLPSLLKANKGSRGVSDLTQAKTVETAVESALSLITMYMLEASLKAMQTQEQDDQYNEGDRRRECIRILSSIYLKSTKIFNSRTLFNNTCSTDIASFDAFIFERLETLIHTEHEWRNGSGQPIATPTQDPQLS